MKLICSFAIVMLIPGMMIGYISYDTAKSKVGDQLIQAADQNVDLLNQIVTSTISSRMKELEYLTTVIGKDQLQGANPEVWRLLADYQKLHPDINTIFVGQPDKSFFNAPAKKLEDGFDPTVRPWYAGAMKDTAKVFIASPYVSRTTGDYVIAFSKILQDGSGVIGAEIKLADLANAAGSVRVGERGYAVILDQQRKAIAHAEFESGAELSGSWVDTVFGNANGDQEYVSDSGVNKRIRYTTNEVTGWKIGGVIDMDEKAEQAFPILKKTLLVLGLSFVAFGFLAILLIILITKPLKELGAAAADISRGDLTRRARVYGRDEIALLGNSFNDMADSLRSLLTQVSDLSMQLAASSQQLTASSEQTTKATLQIAESIQEVAAGSSRQAESVDKGFGSIRSMSEGMADIEKGSTAVSQSADEASEQSGEGSVVMESALVRMDEVQTRVDRLEQVMGMLDQRSSAIGQIAEMMTGIAQQTNILSINASIEAARAGEQGKGFAVVAQEVKKLAEQSRHSAEQIRDMIGSVREETVSAVEVTRSVVSSVGEGSSSLRHAGELFQSIIFKLDAVTECAGQMSEAVRGMSAEAAHAAASMEHVAETASVTAANTHEVSSATEEQLASMEEIASSSAELSRMAENMQQLISRFKV